MPEFNICRLDVSQYLNALTEQELYFIPPPGNAGDAVIALGTYQLFARLGITPWSVNFEDQPYMEGKTILFGGSGNLVEGKYRELHDAILKYLQWGNRCVLLPQTIFGYEDLVKYTQSGQLTIFCREETSYKLCAIANGLDTSNLFLDEDMAFQIDPEFIRPFAEKKGTGCAYCFRTDAESSHQIPLTNSNRDISLSWNGSLWHDWDMTHSVVVSLLTYLSRFETIRTDRLHIAILGSLLGKRVFMYPNSYYKNRAVYELSLANRGNTFFVNTDPSFQGQTLIQ